MGATREEVAEMLAKHKQAMESKMEADMRAYFDWNLKRAEARMSHLAGTVNALMKGVAEEVCRAEDLLQRVRAERLQLSLRRLRAERLVAEQFNLYHCADDAGEYGNDDDESLAPPELPGALDEDDSSAGDVMPPVLQAMAVAGAEDAEDSLLGDASPAVLHTRAEAEDLGCTTQSVIRQIVAEECEATSCHLPAAASPCHLPAAASPRLPPAALEYEPPEILKNVLAKLNESKLLRNAMESKDLRSAPLACTLTPQGCQREAASPSTGSASPASTPRSCQLEAASPSKGSALAAPSPQICWSEAASPSRGSTRAAFSPQCCWPEAASPSRGNALAALPPHICWPEAASPSRGSALAAPSPQSCWPEAGSPGRASAAAACAEPVFRPEDARIAIADVAVPAGELGEFLQRAVAAGDAEAVRRLAEHAPAAALRAQLQEEDKYGNTPLHFAVIEGHTELVAVLASLAKDMGLTEEVLLRPAENRRTPLHLAAAYGRAEAIAVLLDAAADSSARSEWLLKPSCVGRTPLHLAGKYGQAEAVAALLDAAADDSERRELLLREDSNGQTPLHFAAMQGRVAAVTAMLDAAADGAVIRKMLLKTDAYKGFTPLHLMAAHGHHEAASALVRVATAIGALREALQQRSTNGHTPQRLAQQKSLKGCRMVAAALKAAAAQC